MKTFKQFQEGLVGSALKVLGKTKLIDIAKVGAGAFAVKKGAEYLGKKKGESDVKKEQPKKQVKPKFENPEDGSIPERQSGESLTDYYKRRNKGLQDAINKS